ncbi:hypothetical protein PYCC9005_000899 [Savitreella phatthalungensis]
MVIMRPSQKKPGFIAADKENTHGSPRGSSLVASKRQRRPLQILTGEELQRRSASPRSAQEGQAHAQHEFMTFLAPALAEQEAFERDGLEAMQGILGESLVGTAHDKAEGIMETRRRRSSNGLVMPVKLARKTSHVNSMMDERRQALGHVQMATEALEPRPQSVAALRRAAITRATERSNRVSVLRSMR